MAFLGFRLRGAARDRETDTARLRRLSETLSDLSAQIGRECTGLQGRYRAASDSAAFSMEALENGGGEAASSQVESLTEAMERSLRRIEFLQAEATLLDTLHSAIARFATEHGIESPARLAPAVGANDRIQGKP
ncbi:hypothetical protein [Mesorhizobium sp.]|jgi:hypothetical protein|uniref:hypothetical protein n=1 Tax=Mesorhizobium sp. TaxID=1871066 RepID=UPI003561D63B